MPNLCRPKVEEEEVQEEGWWWDHAKDHRRDCKHGRGETTDSLTASGRIG